MNPTVETPWDERQRKLTATLKAIEAEYPGCGLLLVIATDARGKIYASSNMSTLATIMAAQEAMRCYRAQVKE